ncbi:MAG: nucleotidyltransferase family protein [Oscillospiraceae bacterium]|nr:nucleotidyltransferase family protein [Oscillospiraceae bacterium]
MKTVGIICEYNPFHCGHARQFALLRETLGEDTAIVCAMSGHFVQRGEPAIFPADVRAAAAARAGADLVVELPPTISLRAAEGFARGGVETLDRLGICDFLAFGSETAGREPLAAAQAMAALDFDARLQAALKEGLPYGAAKQQVLAAISGIPDILLRPNDILGAEYCRALTLAESRMAPLPVKRDGDDRATELDDSPSATAMRCAMAAGRSIDKYLPIGAAALYRSAAPHFLSCGEKAMLARFRAMDADAWAQVAHNSEGLDNKVRKAVQAGLSVEEILSAAKSKRYPRTRISRLLLCAYLGLTKDDLLQSAPYVRILAFGKRGRELARQVRKAGCLLLNPTEKLPSCGFADLQQRTALLYELFAKTED